MTLMCMSNLPQKKKKKKKKPMPPCLYISQNTVTCPKVTCDMKVCSSQPPKTPHVAGCISRVMGHGMEFETKFETMLMSFEGIQHVTQWQRMYIM